ncbi:hypothetical protein Q5752_005263 [Cryptotrichosporon argae]
MHVRLAGVLESLLDADLVSAHLHAGRVHERHMELGLAEAFQEWVFEDYEISFMEDTTPRLCKDMRFDFVDEQVGHVHAAYEHYLKRGEADSVDGDGSDANYFDFDSGGSDADYLDVDDDVFEGICDTHGLLHSLNEKTSVSSRFDARPPADAQPCECCGRKRVSPSHRVLRHVVEDVGAYNGLPAERKATRDMFDDVLMDDEVDALRDCWW